MALGASFSSSEESGNQDSITPQFDSGALRRRRGSFSTAISIIAVIGLLLMAPLAGVFPSRPSTSSLLGGGRSGANSVGAELGEAHPTDASLTVAQGGPKTLVPEDDPGGPSVVATVPVGMYPEGAAVDAAKGEVFVTNYESNNVSVINDTSDTVVATVPVGSAPVGATYDTAKDEVLVTNTGSNSVSVINDTTDTVVATIQVGSAPDGAAYDAAKGEVFVTNYYSYNVSVVNDTTDTVVATVPVGANPSGAAYDVAKGEVFVTNYGFYNVSVINDTNDTVVATVPVGSAPVGAAYDAAKGEVFVTDYGVNSVSVINDTTDTMLVLVPVGSAPVGAAYDAANGMVFVTNEGSNSVSVIYDTSDTVVATIRVGTSPVGAAYDAAKGEVFVTNTGSKDVSVISVPPSWPSAYAVRFTESGLPAGTIWSVGLGNSWMDSTTETIMFTVPNGTYTYMVWPIAGYAIGPNYGWGSVTVNGADRSVSVTFTPAYLVTFTESGLANGTNWYVMLSGNDFQYSVSEEYSNTNAIPFPETNGTYEYEIGSVMGYNMAPSSGSVTVYGADQSVSVTFTSVCTATFTESGIPPKTLAKDGWTVVLNGSREWSTSTTISFTGVAGGTYPVLVTGPSGYVEDSGSLTTVTVSGESSTSVVFEKGNTYTLTFSEKGLAKSQTWCVSLDNATSCSRRTSQSFANLTASSTYGPYGYAVLSPLSGQKISAAIGKTAEPVYGALDLTASTTVAYTFVYDYAVTFTESGLVSGTKWCLTVGTTATCSTGSTLALSLANGTYRLAIAAPRGYVHLGQTINQIKIVGATIITVRFAHGHRSPILY